MSLLHSWNSPVVNTRLFFFFFLIYWTFYHQTNFLSLRPCAVFRCQGKVEVLHIFCRTPEHWSRGRVRMQQSWCTRTDAVPFQSTHAMIEMGPCRPCCCYGARTPHKRMWGLWTPQAGTLNTHVIKRWWPWLGPLPDMATLDGRMCRTMWGLPFSMSPSKERWAEGTSLRLRTSSWHAGSR